MLNSREIATIVWIGALVVVVLVVPRMRRFAIHWTAEIAKAAFVPAIIAIFGLFILWCSASVFVGWRLGLWDLDLLKDTVLIILTVGFPVLFRTVSAKSGTAIFRQIIGETVALSVLLAVYINLEPFPLWLELVLQPALVLILVLIAGAAHVSNGKQLLGCLNVLLSAIGVGILIWTTTRLIVTAGERDWDALWMQLALSVWLPLSMFAYFYAVAFFAAVDTAIARMRRIFEPPARKRVVLAALLGLHLRLRWAAAFTGPFQHQVSRTTTFREARAAMRLFREQVQSTEARQEEHQAHLRVMAGEPGTDGDGAQLDRREFHGTKEALRLISIAQLNRYERLGNRYWSDHTETVIQPVDRFALPNTHGVVVETTPDGQAWRAWRRLPSGWVLGIGGKDGTRGEFLYAAADEPTTWPGSEEWVDATWSPEWPADWDRDDAPVS